MNFRGASSRRAEAQLDLTPLIDAVFLLLIFFLFTATYAQQSEQSVVPVDLPSGTSGEAATQVESLTVVLTAEGNYALQRGQEALLQGLSRGQLEEELRRLHTPESETSLYLRADREVRYGEVMRLLDIVRDIGYRRVFNVIQVAE
jgi:biopolymer transport protein ExbD